MTGQTTLPGWTDETATDVVSCDTCGKDIDGEPLTVIRESDDAVLSMYPSHVGVSTLGRGTLVHSSD